MPLARSIGMTGPYALFADASVTTWLITYGFMVPAPTVPLKAKDVHFDGEGDRHIGEAGDEHFDWQE